MKQLHRRFVTAITLVAAALVVPAPMASALPPGTPATGPVGFSPATGTATATGAPTSSFTLTGVMACPGDTETTGALGQTFLVSNDVDPATLTYDAAGPTTAGQPAGAFIRPLNAAAGGAPVVAFATADGSGQIDPLPALSLDALTMAGVSIPSGTYLIGAACSVAGDTVAYWATTVQLTTTSGAVTWTHGSTPGAPTITNTTVTTNAVVVEFTPVSTDPPVDAYTATATPNAGGAPISVSGGSSPLTINGLLDGTAYSITVTATNALGTSTSNIVYVSTVQYDYSVASIAAGPGANAGDTVVAWRTPPAVTAPSGYWLSITPTNASDPTIPGSPFALGAEVHSYTVANFPGGACADRYVFEVTPVFPSAFTGTAKSVQAYPGNCPTRPAPVAPPPPTPPSGGSGGGVTALGSIGQVATVQRPAGALVLTQRCGVNSAFPAEPGTDAFPGFPAVGPIGASANDIGTAPALSPGGTTLDDAPGQFSDYPNPTNPIYPTYCGADLGAATFITDGDQLEGQYFAASGVIDEVTVLDSRDIDRGWVARGAITDFTAGPGIDQTFDGNFLGWRPVVTSSSDAVIDGPGSTYQQVVAAGPAVLPGTGINDDSGLGSTTGRVLAQSIVPSPGLGGLGIATINARLKVLIPVINDSGVYSATLSITVV